MAVNVPTAEVSVAAFPPAIVAPVLYVSWAEMQVPDESVGGAGGDGDLSVFIIIFARRRRGR